MNKLITIFLLLPMFSIGQIESEYKNISISEYFGVVDSTINKYSHHDNYSSTILRLTDSSKFYFEFQKCGSFDFSYGTYRQTSDSLILTNDSIITFDKIKEFNSNKNKFLWDYIPMSYINELQFIFNQELIYIIRKDRNKTPWKTLKVDK